jgi:hypothetical protein
MLFNFTNFFPLTFALLLLLVFFCITFFCKQNTADLVFNYIRRLYETIETKQTKPGAGRPGAGTGKGAGPKGNEKKVGLLESLNIGI